MSTKKVILISALTGFLTGTLGSGLVHYLVIITVKYLRLKVM